mgnify:CR=1 FL=1
MEEELSEEDDLEFNLEYGAEYLSRVILAYERVFKDISEEIRTKVLETNDNTLIELFNKIITRSNFLRKRYGSGKMVTNLQDFIQFLEENMDKFGLGIGIDLWGISWVEFKHKLREEDKAKLEAIAREYNIVDDSEFEIDDTQCTF